VGYFFDVIAIMFTDRTGRLFFDGVDFLVGEKKLSSLFFVVAQPRPAD
jgi:hypothetical protein